MGAGAKGLAAVAAGAKGLGSVAPGPKGLATEAVGAKGLGTAASVVPPLLMEAKMLCALDSCALLAWLANDTECTMGAGAAPARRPAADPGPVARFHTGSTLARGPAAGCLVAATSASPSSWMVSGMADSITLLLAREVRPAGRSIERPPSRLPRPSRLGRRSSRLGRPMSRLRLRRRLPEPRLSDMVDHRPLSMPLRSGAWSGLRLMEANLPMLLWVRPKEAGSAKGSLRGTQHWGVFKRLGVGANQRGWRRQLATSTTRKWCV